MTGYVCKMYNKCFGAIQNVYCKRLVVKLVNSKTRKFQNLSSIIENSSIKENEGEFSNCCNSFVIV